MQTHEDRPTEVTPVLRATLKIINLHAKTVISIMGSGWLPNTTGLDFRQKETGTIYDLQSNK